MMELHSVVALPSGFRGTAAAGTALRTALRGLGVDVESICAENATCGKCKVLVEDGVFEQYGIASRPGNLSPRTPEELDYVDRRSDLLHRRGWDPEQVRLACQARVLGDVVVTVPEESRRNRQVVRKSPSSRPIDVRPLLRNYLVELAPPSLANPKSDWDRLASGVSTSMGLVRSGESGVPRSMELRIDPACLRSLSEVLRRSNWRVTVTLWNDLEVVSVKPGLDEALYGAALDVGTTTLALYLCDLSTGATLVTVSDANPQIEYGEDVMSRIEFCNAAPDGLHILHTALIRSINRLLVQGAEEAGIERDEILELVMVGNTTMQHLFLNLPPRHLGVAPFTPVTSRAIDLKARDLGIAINRSGNLHVLPSIASFIGADTTAALLAEQPHEQDENWLIIDIGTNAELVLGNRRRLLCASTPTGPALEGAHIEHGMRAAPRAIEHLRIRGPSLRPEWKLIGESEWGQGRPKGLCGSAVVDAVAELVRAGAVDARGRFTLRADSDRVRRGAAGLEYVVAWAAETAVDADITLTQRDVRQIQLAKAALFVAAESLLEQFCIETPDKVILAGAFGSFMDKQNAMAIGLLPSMDLDRVFVVGNAAGDGARIALLNGDQRRSASAVAGRVGRYELPTDPAFQERFIRALAFPAERKPRRRPP